MEECPYKWPDESFKEYDIISMEKTVVGSALELSAKKYSHWTSTN